MNKKIIGFALFLILMPGITRADFSIARWAFFKNIDITAGGLVRVILDEEVFAKAKYDLSDLRVIAEDNKETPFKMSISRTLGKTEQFYPVLINNSYQPGKFTSVILDFKDKGSSVNRLTINTLSENFQRNVIIYGSDDRTEWSIIKEDGYIYDYTDRKGNAKSANTTLNFSDSIFRYLKLEISDPENQPIKINSVIAVRYVPDNVKEVEKTPAMEKINRTANKTSEIILDLGSNGIPTNKIKLTASDSNFDRFLSVYSSFNNTNWRLLDNGYIFRYNTVKFNGENLTINFPETNDRYIKVIIANKDNDPLNIISAVTYTIFREIIFQAETGKAYKLYYGNNNARFPEYDLEKYFQYLDIENAQSAVLSAEQANPQMEKPKPPVTPASEKLPYLMTAALIISSLLLIFLIYKFFQKK